MSHNKETFAREYCLARRIPYKLHNEGLVIKSPDGHYMQVCFSVYNLTYKDLIEEIDRCCEYNPTTTYFERCKERM